MMIGFQLIFFVFVTFIIFINISKYIKNENSPIISTKAKLIKKKRETCTNTDSNVVMTTTEKLILEFELDTGSEIKFTVGRRVFKNVPEHEWGTLTFQGTRFLKFNSLSGVVEK